MTTETAQAFIVAAPLKPEDLLEFFKYHTAKSFGGYVLIANGLQVKDAKAPFTYVILQPGSVGINIILNRNVFFKKKITGLEIKGTFGVIIFPGAKLVARTKNVLTYTITKPIKDVFDYYQNIYRKVPKVTMFRSDAGANPILTINGMQATTKWRTISVMKDPTHAGNVYLSIMARQ